MISTFNRTGAAAAVSGTYDSIRAIPLLPRSAALGLVLAVLAVALIAAASYRSLQARTNSANLVTQTLRSMELLRALVATITDAESGQRAFLLTGDESYLMPYQDASSQLPAKSAELRALLTDAVQVQRLDEIEALAARRFNDLGQNIELRRADKMSEAITLVRTNRGKELMERIRVLTGESEAYSQELLGRRQAEWEAASSISILVTIVGSGLLLFLIAAAAAVVSRDFRQREIQAWVRMGQMQFATTLQGDQRLEILGERATAFLAHYLGAQVGAAYVTDGGEMLRRMASYATAAAEQVKPGEGLLGQAVKENRVVHVKNVPEGYFTVTSTLGRADAREVVVAPAAVDGKVHAVVELGFFRKILPDELELLSRLSESFGMAVRASKDRTRLEELLEETQRQGEELQSQQEELRTSNEELETQARALKESQTHLQSQQAELEQINSQLEEQAQVLETQKDELAKGQEVLAEKAAELERANQYKSEFLANMSHELRTPLNSSLILAKLLADNKNGNLTPEQVDFSKTILAAGNDLLAIINDVLDLSKIEAGKIDLTVESVSIPKMADGLTKSFQPLAQQKNLAFDVSVENGVPSEIESDSQRLAQILKNLLSNAIKFTDAGRVTLRVVSQGAGGVAFVVSDTGIGIPPQQQQIIFEAFRQADGSTHRRFGGTGLGLSISKDLAELLGGTITVESTPNAGSVFTLTVPLAMSKPEVRPMPMHLPAGSSAPPTRSTPMSANGGARTGKSLAPTTVKDDRDQLTAGSRFILVIEDDARFAAILRDLARERGFQCVVTQSASDGLTAAEMWMPSAIVLDINLPDHSGLGVLDQLKRNPKTRHIPVHIASVVDFTQEALGLGAVGYALKPVKREELDEAFQRLEAKFAQRMKHVLVVEDDDRQRESVRQLLIGDDVNIVGVKTATEALAKLQSVTFDCVVMDLNLPDLSGFGLLQKMADEEGVSFPPVIIYTGRSLSRDEETQLRRLSKSIIVKDARSPERLLDEVTLFLHQVEDKLPEDRQRMLRTARAREAVFENRRILVVEDDVRNIFALTSLLEPKGVKIDIARNGKEAIAALHKHTDEAGLAIDLVLMDIMMPEMDGFTAMREIRKRADWAKLPIVALTAKAMRDDQEKCLAAGANDYIAKPLDVEKLLSLIRVWLPK